MKFLLIMLCLLKLEASSQTAIFSKGSIAIAAISLDTVIVAADTKMTVINYDSNDTTYKIDRKTNCINKFLYGFAGFTQSSKLDGSVNWDCLQIMDSVSKISKDLEECSNKFEDKFKSLFSKYMNNLPQFEKDNAIKYGIIAYFIITFVNDKAVYKAKYLYLNYTPTNELTILTIDQTKPLPRFKPIGHTTAIDSFLNGNSNYLKVSYNIMGKRIVNLIDIQSKSTGADVGWPIDYYVMTKKGF